MCIIRIFLLILVIISIQYPATNGLQWMKSRKKTSPLAFIVRKRTILVKGASMLRMEFDRFICIVEVGLKRRICNHNFFFVS